MVLQESDMFMDALTASTKSKEPRKRKRRTSITKDGPTEAKKQETATSDSRDASPPPTSPPSADEKSPVVVKPNFKVRVITFAAVYTFFMYPNLMTAVFLFLINVRINQ